MSKGLKQKLKSVPFIGSLLVRVKRYLREARAALINFAYYTRTNLDRSEGGLVITDTSHTNSKGRGLFSLFREVLDIISSNGQKDIRVEYHQTLYNDRPNENMWEYYFHPIRNDIKKKYIRFFTTRPFRNVFSSENPDEITLFHEIISDRIRIKEEPLEKAERFWKDALLGKKTVGIHYRGTDIHITTDMYPDILKEPRLEEYFSLVDAQLWNGYDAVFLATDEDRILRRFEERYGEKLVYREVERSVDGRGLHQFNSNKRQQGEDVIIDALLLSKCDFLLYGCSNVSTVVKYLHPSLPSKNMSLI